MAKRKMTVTIAPEVLAEVDAAARSAGLNRSEYVERVLRHEQYRRMLASAPPPPMPRAEQKQLRGLLSWQRDVRSDPPPQSA